MAYSLLRNPNLSSRTIIGSPSLPAFSSISASIAVCFLPCRRCSIPLHAGRARRLSCSVSDPSPLPPNLPRLRPDYIPNRIYDPNYVKYTTLRAGEHSPRATLTSKEKLDIGVEIIDAGFPAASKDDFEADKTIAETVGTTIYENGYGPVICGLSWYNKKDIEMAREVVKYAKWHRIHTFIATSDIHLKYKLKKSKEDIVEIAKNMVKFTRSLRCEDRTWNSVQKMLEGGTYWCDATLSDYQWNW